MTSAPFIAEHDPLIIEHDEAPLRMDIDLLYEVNDFLYTKLGSGHGYILVAAPIGENVSPAVTSNMPREIVLDMIRTMAAVPDETVSEHTHDMSHLKDAP